jgi:hypothetical protein
MDQFRDLPPLPELTAREKLEILNSYLRMCFDRGEDNGPLRTGHENNPADGTRKTSGSVAR